MSKKMMDRNYQKMFKISGYENMIKNANEAISTYKEGEILSGVDEDKIRCELIDIITIDIGAEYRNFCSCGYVSSQNKTDKVICPNCGNNSRILLTDNYDKKLILGRFEYLYSLNDDKNNFSLSRYEPTFRISDDETEIIIEENEVILLTIENGNLYQYLNAYQYNYYLIPDIIINSKTFRELTVKAKPLDLSEIMSSRYRLSLFEMGVGLIQSNQLGDIDYDSWLGQEALFLQYCLNPNLQREDKYLSLNSFLDKIIVPEDYPGKNTLDYLQHFELNNAAWTRTTPDSVEKINSLTRKLDNYSDNLRETIMFLLGRDNYKLSSIYNEIHNVFSHLSNMFTKEEIDDIIIQFINYEVSRLNTHTLQTLVTRISRLKSIDAEINIFNLRTKQFNLLLADSRLKDYKINDEKMEIFKKFLDDYPREAYSVFASRRKLTKSEIKKFDELEDKMLI